MLSKTFNIQPQLAFIGSFAVLNSLTLCPLVEAQESPFKKSVQSQTTFMAKECSVQLSDPEENMEMNCDRLSITEGDGTINFHYDDGEEVGFSFVLTYNDEPILVNDKINTNKYDVIGSFMWTAEEGIVDETLTEATGTCNASPEGVACQATIDTTIKVQAEVAF